MLYTNKKCNEPEESDNSVFLLDELNIFYDILLHTNININMLPKYFITNPKL